MSESAESFAAAVAMSVSGPVRFSTPACKDVPGAAASGAVTTTAITSGAYVNGSTTATDASGSIATSGSLATGNVQTVNSANALISQVDVALKSVADFAAQLGAVQNRFQSTIATVAAQSTNLQASRSTIQDANFAAETAALSKANVLQQAGISVLAQANANPQMALKLLQ